MFITRICTAAVAYRVSVIEIYFNICRMCLCLHDSIRGIRGAAGASLHEIRSISQKQEFCIIYYVFIYVIIHLLCRSIAEFIYLLFDFIFVVQIIFFQRM